MFRKIQDKLYSLRDEWKYDFYDCIRDIAEHPVVLRMRSEEHTSELHHIQKSRMPSSA